MDALKEAQAAAKAKVIETGAVYDAAVAAVDAARESAPEGDARKAHMAPYLAARADAMAVMNAAVAELEAANRAVRAAN